MAPPPGARPPELYVEAQHGDNLETRLVDAQSLLEVLAWDRLERIGDRDPEDVDGHSADWRIRKVLAEICAPEEVPDTGRVAQALMGDLWTPWRGYWVPRSADHEVRDVFAHFGVVAYYLQVLEMIVGQQFAASVTRPQARPDGRRLVGISLWRERPGGHPGIAAVP